MEHQGTPPAELEGGNIVNSLNFSLPYNDLTGANYTGAWTVNSNISLSFRHPSARGTRCAR